ncbi:short-chain dehydrogenase [Mesorhizobium sp. 113-1-2]|uniref:NnrS family protein n=1 Tax=Mesorhizobium sp. 113-1-2 TaxID=2744515 RepID=UPI0019296D73|nr:NnrS family protein [Mesorhizobium sp. 113-1-2]BCG75204.1 short-chain dehydrogenase [Mesorhizobium sp. 113-1-2]
MAIPRTRPGAHPTILSNGFRPFFLLGSLFGGGAILFWLPLYDGKLETFSAFSAVDWHVHELLFGYLAAVVTGFLLTAIPNWTGRLPLQGLPLLALVVLWSAGRLAVFFSAETGWLLGAVVDCAFLLAVVIAAAVEIVAGRNWRNLKVLLPVTVLLAANVMFHAEAHTQGVTDTSRRLGLGAAIVLVMIIGGRIIPSFTRNWLVRERPGRLPVPFGRFDTATILFSAFGLLGWTFYHDHAVTGSILIAAAILNAIRLARWAGDRTLRDPLVLILHASFAFVPIGLFLAGLATFVPEEVPAAAGIHAFGVGALASMTLAVMSRATLGHTGRELRATIGTCVVFAAILLAAMLRILAAFAPAVATLLHMAAALWIIAFIGYAVLFGRMLVMPRLQARRPANAA